MRKTLLALVLLGTTFCSDNRTDYEESKKAKFIKSNAYTYIYNNTQYTNKIDIIKSRGNI